MSDVMLFGVLKMPYEMAMESELSRLQFYQRVQQLVARFEAQPPLPQRTWVGLTEVDILAASRHWRHAEDFMAGVYWAAGTLKEFNT
jgi:hypothetical protein